MSQTTAGIPLSTAPFVDERGFITTPWLQLLITLWGRSGQASAVPGTPAVLNPGVQLQVVIIDLYRVPSGGQATISQATFVNVHTASHTFTVYRVPNGDTPNASNKIIDNMTLLAGQSYVAPELANMVLNVGDSIQAVADSGAVINAFMSGYTS